MDSIVDRFKWSGLAVNMAEIWIEDAQLLREVDPLNPLSGSLAEAMIETLSKAGAEFPEFPEQLSASKVKNNFSQKSLATIAGSRYAELFLECFICTGIHHDFFTILMSHMGDHSKVYRSSDELVQVLFKISIMKLQFHGELLTNSEEYGKLVISELSSWCDGFNELAARDTEVKTVDAYDLLTTPTVNIYPHMEKLIQQGFVVQRG